MIESKEERERMLFAMRTGQINIKDLEGAVIKEILEKDNRSAELVLEIKGVEYLWGLKFSFDI